MTNTDNKNTLEAPEYRYYLVDLLSGKIYAEAPFSGVSYERAIKGAGSFSGKLPVLDTEANRSWDLYKSTMPGKTGLYILRDDECVWGGIIWSRDYSVVDKTLTVSASEFTSYFHHRRIWKTWSNVYSATVVSEDDDVTVTFDSGYVEGLYPGDSVHMAFKDMQDYKYSGFYVVAEDPAPTSTDDDAKRVNGVDEFHIEGGVSSVDIVAVERDDDWNYYYTNGNHNFSTDDQITVTMDLSLYASFNGTFSIVSPSGSAASYFQVPNQDNLAVYDKTATNGTATRPLPDHTWEEVTVSVRSDTYSYIRALVRDVFEDFQGIDFANTYIEPGLAYELDIVRKQAEDGIATITTADPHGLINGQTVTIQSLGDDFNGDHTVTRILSDTVFQYRGGGNTPPTSVTPTSWTVTQRRAGHNTAQIWTSQNHDIDESDTIHVVPGNDVDGNAAAFGGTFVVSDTTTRTISYPILTSITTETVSLKQPVSTRNGVSIPITRRSLDSNQNVMRYTTAVPHHYSVGQTVSVTGLDYTVPVVQKSFDAATNIAILDTGSAHHLQNGDSVTIGGIRDSAQIVAKESTNTSATLYTASAHNFRASKRYPQTVTIGGLHDNYHLTQRSIASHIATLTTDESHNIQSGDDVIIYGVYDYYGINQKRISDNIATITTSANHAMRVNDVISISSVADKYNIGSKYANNGTVMLIMERQHNFHVGSKIVVSGTGKPFDGTYTVTRVTDTHIYYRIKSKAHYATTTSRGSVSGSSPVFNGTHTVIAVTPRTIQFRTSGNDLPTTDVGDGTVRSASPVNGKHTVYGTPTANTFRVQLASDVADLPNGNIYISKKKGTVKPYVAVDSILNGNHVITKVGKNSFTFNQSIPHRFDKVSNSATASVPSIFNGTHTVINATTSTIQFTLTSPGNSVSETAVRTAAYASAPNIFNVTNKTITSVDPSGTSFTISGGGHPGIPSAPVAGYGTVTKRPVAIVHTYGSFPGNSDIGIHFSTDEHSGATVRPPEPYRGMELTNVGEALDQYSDNIDGFEYRIDCDYDAETDQFTRTFVLIPINFPDPPAPGKISPISRFGADKLVFEYPGNISNFSMTESAENSSTRFFAVGDIEGDSSDDYKPQAAAAATEMLEGDGPEDSKWPILDDDEKIKGIADKDVLYAYAKRYLSEGRPPGISITMEINGSLPPVVGTYDPGDWCSIVVNDEFVRQRLATKLEPRDNVIVRKIESIKVDVPDGTTAPEKVTLGLVAEWEVDKVGE